MVNVVWLLSVIVAIQKKDWRGNLVKQGNEPPLPYYHLEQGDTTTRSISANEQLHTIQYITNTNMMLMLSKWLKQVLLRWVLWDQGV